MRVRLTNKEVQDGTNCPWCNMEPETPEHVLLQCIKSSKTCSAVKGDKFCMGVARNCLPTHVKLTEKCMLGPIVLGVMWSWKQQSMLY